MKVDDRKDQNSLNSGGSRKWKSLPHQGWSLVLAFIVVSAGIHISSLFVVQTVKNWTQKNRPHPEKLYQPSHVRVKITPNKVEPKPKDDPLLSKILEAPQEENTKEKPDEARYLSEKKHKTDRETKVDPKLPRPKAMDPGPLASQTQKTPEKNQKPGDSKPKNLNEAQVKISSLPPQPKKQKKINSNQKDPYKVGPRNKFESLLPHSLSDLGHQVQAGYQDYIQDKMALGDRIDINTSEYRYIGYFTALRKAIELVWNYPRSASSRGMQGEVNLEFAIDKKGHASQVKVLKSSGYNILDTAIVNAIRLASPFSPLPDGFGKERIVVTGSFRYVLSGFSMAH